MKCNICGADMPEGNRFCLACGAKLEGQADDQAGGAGAASSQPSDLGVEPAAKAAQTPHIQPLASAEPAAAEADNAAVAGNAAECNAAFAAGTDPSPACSGVNPVQPVPPQMGRANPPAFFEDNLTPVVSVGSWLLSLLLLMIIPIAATVLVSVITALVDNVLLTNILSALVALTPIIMMFIWAFNKHVNPSKRNFFRAALIYVAIMVAICIVIFIVFSSMLTAYFSQMGISGFEELLQMLDNLY